MKWFISILCFYPILCFSSTDDIASTFENETYKIELSQGNCVDNDLACDGITYHSLNKKNGSVLTIMNGSTLNEGELQNFRGYIFRNKDYFYTLTPDPDSYSNESQAWILTVTKNTKGKDKILLQQKIY
ncbi:hypothetical protein GJV04_08295 [Enterobacteriaceae bacterium RIT714]|nr:hypothetical protein [Enterobacteriaceae bacterium RIT714]